MTCIINYSHILFSHIKIVNLDSIKGFLCFRMTIRSEPHNNGSFFKRFKTRLNTNSNDPSNQRHRQIISSRFTDTCFLRMDPHPKHFLGSYRMAVPRALDNKQFIIRFSNNSRSKLHIPGHLSITGHRKHEMFLLGG